MGIIEFIKSAGEALGIGDEPPSQETLKKEIDKHGLGSDKIEIEVKEDKAIISGEAEDQSALEKIILAAGNVLGIGSVESRAKTKRSGAESSFHTVAKGDTLWKIAEKRYGDGSKYKIIFEANKPMLTHPDKIYPGQVLRIPPQ